MKNKTNFLNQITVTSNEVGQRIDNFLFKKFKRVSKIAIYCILRKGKILVNKKKLNLNINFKKMI